LNTFDVRYAGTKNETEKLRAIATTVNYMINFIIKVNIFLFSLYVQGLTALKL